MERSNAFLFRPNTEIINRRTSEHPNLDLASTVSNCFRVNNVIDFLSEIISPMYVSPYLGMLSQTTGLGQQLPVVRKI